MNITVTMYYQFILFLNKIIFLKNFTLENSHIQVETLEKSNQCEKASNQQKYITISQIKMIY